MQWPDFFCNIERGSEAVAQTKDSKEVESRCREDGVDSRRGLNDALYEALALLSWILTAGGCYTKVERMSAFLSVKSGVGCCQEELVEELPN